MLRFGKSTHISMISNSVTHLRSYPTPQSPISPETPRDRRRLRIERRRYRRIEWPRDLRRCCPKHRRFHIERRRLRIERRYRRFDDKCFMMFHNVLRVFHDVLPVVHNVLRCITMFYMCFMMFYNVLWCLASRATIGVAASATVRPPIASGITTTPQKFAITPQKSAMAPQRSSISPRTWSHAKLHPEWRLE